MRVIEVDILERDCAGDTVSRARVGRIGQFRDCPRRRGRLGDDDRCIVGPGPGDGQRERLGGSRAVIIRDRYVVDDGERFALRQEVDRAVGDLKCPRHGARACAGTVGFDQCERAMVEARELRDLTWAERQNLVVCRFPHKRRIARARGMGVIEVDILEGDRAGGGLDAARVRVLGDRPSWRRRAGYDRGRVIDANDSDRHVLARRAAMAVIHGDRENFGVGLAGRERLRVRLIGGKGPDHAACRARRRRVGSGRVGHHFGSEAADRVPGFHGEGNRMRIRSIGVSAASSVVAWVSSITVPIAVSSAPSEIVGASLMPSTVKVSVRCSVSVPDLTSKLTV